MNLLLIRPADILADACVSVCGRHYEHLKKIVRVQPGDIIRAGVINGKLGEARITAIDATSITLELHCEQAPPPPSLLTLVLALPRPLMLKRILQTVTSFGVKEIHLIHTARVEKSYWNSSDLDASTLEHQLLLGLEQAGDTMLPTLHFHRNFQRFFADELPALCRGKRALLAHPGNYPRCPAGITETTVLAIGPEGGFVDDEVAAFIDAVFEPIQLGQRILRVEAAVPALLGRLS